MTDVVTKDLGTTMEDHIEASFNLFMGDYELDIEGSLEDMLFEFFAEGFIQALGEADGDEE